MEASEVGGKGIGLFTKEWFWGYHSLHAYFAEMYSELRQTSKMERFVKIINGF